MGKKASPSWTGLDTKDLGRRRWRLAGRIELDEATRELWVDGERVAMEPKPLDCLLALLRHPAGFITKPELMTSVWNGRPVTESVLGKSMAKLRAALKDADQAIIRTQHGHGYRLMVAGHFVLPSDPDSLPLRKGDTLANAPHLKLTRPVAGQPLQWLATDARDGSSLRIHFATADGLPALRRRVAFYQRGRELTGIALHLETLVDWQLKSPPYFVALPEPPPPPFSQWVIDQGGFAAWPLPQRMLWAEHIIESVAALHAAGLDFAGHLQADCIAVASATLAAPLRLIFSPEPGVGVAHPAAYQAPEVAQGIEDAQRADVFALGTLLYQLWVGEWGSRLMPGWNARVEDPVLKRLLWRATNQHLPDRFRDADELLKALHKLPGQRAEEAAAEAARRHSEAQAAEAARRQLEAERAAVQRRHEETLAAERSGRELEVASLRGSLFERLRRQRQSLVLAGGGLLLALMLVALGVSLYQQRALQRSLDVAREQQGYITEHILYGSDPHGFAFWSDEPATTDPHIDSQTLLKAMDSARTQLSSRPPMLLQAMENVADNLRGLNEYTASAALHAEAAALAAQEYGQGSPQQIGFLRKRGYALIEGGELAAAKQQASALSALARQRGVPMPCLAQASGDHIEGWAEEENRQTEQARLVLTRAAQTLADCRGAPPQLGIDISWDLASSALELGQFAEARKRMETVQAWYGTQGRNKASSHAWSQSTLLRAQLAMEDFQAADLTLSQLRGIASGQPPESRAVLLADRSEQLLLLARGEAKRAATLGVNLEGRLRSRLGDGHAWRLNNLYWTSLAHAAASAPAWALATAQDGMRGCEQACGDNPAQWLMQASALVHAEHRLGERHRIALQNFQAQLARIGATPFAYRAHWWLAESLLQDAEQAGSGKARRQAALAEMRRVYGQTGHWLPKTWLEAPQRAASPAP